MSIKPSGLWCDLCRKPIFHDPYWDCSINGKPGHSCDKCKDNYEKKDSKTMKLMKQLDGREARNKDNV